MIRIPSTNNNNINKTPVAGAYGINYQQGGNLQGGQSTIGFPLKSATGTVDNNTLWMNRVCTPVSDTQYTIFTLRSTRFQFNVTAAVNRRAFKCLQWLGLKIDEQDSRRFVLYVDNEEYPLVHEFLYYKSMEGDNTKDYKRSSGAYIFRPDGPPVPVCDGHKKPIRISGKS